MLGLTHKELKPKTDRQAENTRKKEREREGETERGTDDVWLRVCDLQEIFVASS